jgi:hypothetical protein
MRTRGERMKCSRKINWRRSLRHIHNSCFALKWLSDTTDTHLEKLVNNQLNAPRRNVSYHFKLRIAILNGEMLLFAFLRIMEAIFDDVKVR